MLSLNARQYLRYLTEDPIGVTITSPANGSSVKVPEIQISWTLVSGVQQNYLLRVFSDAAATTLVYSSGYVQSPSMTHTIAPGNLSAETTYWYRISVITQDNLPAESAVWSFYTGIVATGLELQWGLGGRTLAALELQWEVAPSFTRTNYSLTGQYGPVVYGFRFEKRTHGNAFLQDITPAVIGASIDLDNTREVLRTGKLSLHTDASDDKGNLIEIDILRDHIAIVMDLLVDANYIQTFQLGLFHCKEPKTNFSAGSRNLYHVLDTRRTVDIDLQDLTMHLIEATTTGPYTVAAGQNYITGTNAVASILTGRHLQHSLPNNTKTLPESRTWPVGTKWLTIVNELLVGAGFYPISCNIDGVFRTRALDDPSQVTPSMVYTADDFIINSVGVDQDLTRFANQVIVSVDDPNAGLLVSVATNTDPDHPISTISLGRTISKPLTVSSIANQATLNQLAQTELALSSTYYERIKLTTQGDPRRMEREVYQLFVPGVYDGQIWHVQRWRASIGVPFIMEHDLNRLIRVGETVV